MMNDTANGNTLSAVQANARATGEAFERLANMVAQRTEFAPIADQARERATKLAANKFTVMVLGQFKRGKSTLLNAMLGARVLPMKLTPCTAVVTFLRHGLAPKAFVAFSDNRNPNQEVLSLDEFTEKYERVFRESSG
jgi:septin family protein